MLGVALGGQDLLADSSFSNRSFTPETTKPSHFCGGFVLYGAAPGVESVFSRLIIMDKFEDLNFSTSKTTSRIWLAKSKKLRTTEIMM